MFFGLITESPRFTTEVPYRVSKPVSFGVETSFSTKVPK